MARVIDELMGRALVVAAIQARLTVGVTTAEETVEARPILASRHVFYQPRTVGFWQTAVRRPSGWGMTPSRSFTCRPRAKCRPGADDGHDLAVYRQSRPRRAPKARCCWSQR